MTKTLDFCTLNNHHIKIPSSFNGYNFIEFLDRGGSSVVILVENQMKERYAAKIISKNDIKNRNLYELIKKEISVHKTLKHPNIVQFHDSLEITCEDEKDELIVVIMEYCENGDLLKYVTNTGFKTEAMKKKIICDFLKGIQYLHSQEISHGDIKVENILLDSNLNAKLCDFGYCRTRKIGGNESKNGTLYYAAPELFNNDQFNTLKTDIYSIGITLFAISELTFPFSSKNKDYIVLQIKSGCLSFGYRIDNQLRKLIEKCTNLKPENRPEIDEILNDEYLKGKPKSLMKNEIDFKRRWSIKQNCRFPFEYDVSD